MRFRYSGTNWEGRRWVLTAGGVALGKQVERIWPDRHPADGTVASKGHDQRNPNSDHRPRPFSGPGIVRALDVGENVEDDGIKFAEMLRASRDPRIKYVLHEDRIFSSYSRPNREPWEWAPLNIGHPSHVHVSFTELADTDSSPWNLNSDQGDEALLPLMYGHGYSTPPNDALVSGDQSHRVEDVRALQDLLNFLGAGLQLDGVYGPATIVAVRDKTGQNTGNPDGQEGKWFGGNQYGNLIRDVASTTSGGSHSHDFSHDHDGTYLKDVQGIT